MLLLLMQAEHRFLQLLLVTPPQAAIHVFPLALRKWVPKNGRGHGSPRKRR
jgi:hypothetical protein